MLLTKITLLTLLTVSTTAAKQNKYDSQYTRYIPGDYVGDSDILDIFDLEIGRDMIAKDFLDLKHSVKRLKNPVSIKHSASKFLLQIYNDFKKNEHIDTEDGVEEMIGSGPGIQNMDTIVDETYDTEVDLDLIDETNHVITFASIAPKHVQVAFSATESKFTTSMTLLFNINDIPKNLELVHASLHIYQQPSLGSFEKNMITSGIRIIAVQNIYYLNDLNDEFNVLGTIDSTTDYEGWYEFNITRTLERWIKLKELYPATASEDIVILITPITGHEDIMEFDADDIGLIKPNTKWVEFQPFIASFFHGPKLSTKIRTLLYKRTRKIGFKRTHYPTSCSKLNFTLDFNELKIQNYAIAPKKFETFLCAGPCQFPLGSHVKYTMNAVILHNMHVADPNTDVPTPCCAPLDYGPSVMMHYRNDDSIQLSLYPDSVAMCCGCT